MGVVCTGAAGWLHHSVHDGATLAAAHPGGRYTGGFPEEDAIVLGDVRTTRGHIRKADKEYAKVSQ